MDVSRSRAIRSEGQFGSVVDLKTQPIGPKPKGKRGSKNAPKFDLRTELYRISGIDWAQVNGIDVLTAQTVIAECGADLSAFASEKNFASWLGLCPTNEQSGGKILKRRTRKVVNPHNTADYALGWVPRKRSPPWPES